MFGEKIGLDGDVNYSYCDGEEQKEDIY